MPRTRELLEHAAWSGIRLVLRATNDPTHAVLDPMTHATDPYAAYAALRERGPVLKGRFPGVYVLTGHAAVDHALKRHHVGAAPGEDLPAWLVWDSPLSPSLLDTDPPDHTRLRGLVAQAFTPRAVASLRERAREVAASLLDEVAGDEVVDLVDVFASRLPITMICQMLGVPDDDHRQLLAWGGDVALSLEPRRTPADQRRVETAGEGLRRFFGTHIGRRREELAAGRAPEDVLTNLLRARDGEDRLSDDELLATSILLLGAGFETTVNLIGNGVLALSRNPEQRERLVAGGSAAVRNGVEEMLRLDAPVQFTGRYTWDDDVIDGVEVPKGSSLLCMLAAANRDPVVFDEPDTFDVTRPNAREHLSFSSGRHFCVGAALARLEAEVAFTTLLERHPQVRLAAPARRRANTVLRGLETLPVALG